MNENLEKLKKAIPMLKRKEDFIGFFSILYTLFNRNEITNNDVDDVVATVTIEHGLTVDDLVKYLVPQDNKLVQYINDVDTRTRIKEKVDAANNSKSESTSDDISPDERKICGVVKYFVELDDENEYFRLLAHMDDEAYIVTIDRLFHCRKCDKKIIDEDAVTTSLKRLLHIRPELAEGYLTNRFIDLEEDDPELKEFKDFFIKSNLVNSESVFNRLVAESKLINTDGESIAHKIVNYLQHEQHLIEKGTITEEQAKKMRDKLFATINIVKVFEQVVDKIPEVYKEEMKKDIAYLKEHKSTMVIPLFEIEDDDTETFEIVQGAVYAYMNKHDLFTKDPTFWNRCITKRYVVFYDE